MNQKIPRPPGSFLSLDSRGLLDLPCDPTPRRADGAVSGAELALSRGPAEERRRCATLIRHIATRKRAEATLWTLNAQLERRFLERTAQLQAAHDKLEGIAAVAHRLCDLSNALLAFSRFGHSAMREQCISLAALVEAARCDLRDQIEGRGITPQPHDPPAEDEDPILPSPGLLNEQQPAIGERASSKLAGIAIGLVRLMARLNEQSHRSRVGALPVS